MSPGDERGTAMKGNVRWVVCLVAAALATSCTVYQIKELDGKALAGSSKKGKIVRVQTAEGPVAFSEKDPPAVKDGAVVGNLHLTYTLSPSDIADIAPSPGGPKVVLKDGDRFRVASSWSEGERMKCEAVKAVCIPLDQVQRAQVQTVNAAASVFSTLAGVALVAGAVALDVAINDDDMIAPDESFTVNLVSSMFESINSAPARPRPGPGNAVLVLQDAFRVAEEKEFWTMEWTPVDGPPGEDGKLRVRLDNRSGMPRGIDEAKLVVVDHPPGFTVAPDILGAMRSYSGPVAPESATDSEGKDIREDVSARDGAFWRTASGDTLPGAAAPVRDEITMLFPKPKGARNAKLIVNAANSTWRAEFAREIRARAGPAVPDEKRAIRSKGTSSPYQEWEYGKVRVRMLTSFGWETGQVLFAGGPLPASDMIYHIDLSDVGSDKVQIRLSPPAGYWLIDRLALDFGKDVPIETTEVAAEQVDDPDAAEVLRALAVEDVTTFLLAPSDPPVLLTFIAPPPKEGLERSMFLRTVSCYEMPPRDDEKKNEGKEAAHENKTTQ